VSEVADPATVLVVEDDPALNAALTATLKAAGYRPVAARTAAEGLRWFAHYAPDLVLLDLGLPDRDGLSVIRDIRAKGTTPIVVLSARDAPAMKVEALDLGADDYVQKPFGSGRTARPPARRPAPRRAGAGPPRLSCAPATSRSTWACAAWRWGGRAVALSPKEYDLLAELALNLGRTVPHAELLRAVWGSERADIQYLRVYVGQLRGKLGAGRLASAPGVGYRLEAALRQRGGGSLRRPFRLPGTRLLPALGHRDAVGARLGVEDVPEQAGRVVGQVEVGDRLLVGGVLDEAGDFDARSLFSTVSVRLTLSHALMRSGSEL
jgi:two-component system KDP operon response regulator KdpE